MNKSIVPILMCALFVVAVSSPKIYAQIDSPTLDNGSTHYGWADVLRVDPVYGITRIEVPQQNCYDQTVVEQTPPRSGTAGTLLGAVIGGVLGNTIGNGDGRTAATVVGAVAGGAIGNHISSRPGSQYETTQTRCQQVNTISEQRRIVGYDVEYRYRGDVYMSRLSYDPGERLRVKINISPAD